MSFNGGNGIFKLFFVEYVLDHWNNFLQESKIFFLDFFVIAVSNTRMLPSALSRFFILSKLFIAGCYLMIGLHKVVSVIQLYFVLYRLISFITFFIPYLVFYRSLESVFILWCFVFKSFARHLQQTCIPLYCLILVVNFLSLIVLIKSIKPFWKVCCYIISLVMSRI